MKTTSQAKSKFGSLQKKKKDELIEIIGELEAKQKLKASELKKLKKEISSLDKKNDDMQKDQESLSAKLIQKDLEIDKLLGNQLELEELIQDFELKQEQLETQLAALDTTEQTLDEERIAGRKSSFRIDMYDPGQGHYQGKIEFPLTKEFEPFTGVDKETIHSFISSHLPKTSKKPLDQSRGLNKAAIQASTTETKAATSAVATLDAPLEISLPELQSIRTMRFNVDIPQSQLQLSDPIRVRLVLSKADTQAAAGINYQWQASLYAKPFHSNLARIELNQSERLSFSENEVDVQIPANTFTKGTFRLEAMVRYYAPDGEEIPLVTFKEGDMIYIF